MLNNKYLRTYETDNAAMNVIGLKATFLGQR